MPTPRKRKPLQKPFVVTVAQVAAFALMPGCTFTETSNPPPSDPVCPDTEPTVNSPCAGEDQGCSFDNGVCTMHYTCNNTTLKWELLSGCSNCGDYTLESDCIVDTGCRWLTPGCGMPALPKAGCFAETDCTTDANCGGTGATCQAAEIDPCYKLACDACSMPVKVCLPPP